MIKGHLIERKIKIEEFMEILKGIPEKDITATSHTFFRLEEKERKIFKEALIKDIILKETPLLVGQQYNGCYGVFYKYRKDILRVTLDIQPRKLTIVTFYVIDDQQIPRI